MEYKFISRLADLPLRQNIILLKTNGKVIWTHIEKQNDEYQATGIGILTEEYLNNVFAYCELEYKMKYER